MLSTQTNDKKQAIAPVETDGLAGAGTKGDNNNNDNKNDGIDWKDRKNIAIGVLSLLLLIFIIILIVVAATNDDDKKSNNNGGKSTTVDDNECECNDTSTTTTTTTMDIEIENNITNESYWDEYFADYKFDYTTCFWDDLDTPNDEKDQIGRAIWFNNKTTRQRALSYVKKYKLIEIGFQYSYSDSSNDLQKRYFHTQLQSYDAGSTSSSWGSHYLSVYSNAYGNIGTQFDGFGHVFWKKDKYDMENWVFFNNFRGNEVAGTNGVNYLGLQNLEPIFTRAILLDMVVVLSDNPNNVTTDDQVESSYMITEDDIVDALKYAGLTNGIDDIMVGDVILFYTNWILSVQSDVMNAIFHPWVDVNAIINLFGGSENGYKVSVLGFDTLPDNPIGSSDIHGYWLVCQGGYIHEFMNLEQWVAQARYGDASYIAAYSYTPWKVEGSVGSPGQPFIMY